MKQEEYHRPPNLEEALRLLARFGDQARLVAGATDLMVELRRLRLAGQAPPRCLIDVAGLPQLAGARLEDGHLFLGAGLTFAQCQQHPLITQRLPLLASASRAVGSLQIRNLATLGGNVANMSPAGDGVTVLVGLGTTALLASPWGRREAQVENLVASRDLRPGEILLGFRLPLPVTPGAACFRKVIRRQAVGIARLSLAVQLGRNEDGRIAEARLGLGAVFPSPRRLRQVEALLMGQEPSPDLWRRAARLATSLMLETCGNRPSMAYKQPALLRVAALTLARAWQGGLA